MECFAHPNAAAIAVCKHCGKGVCRACATDIGVAVVCSEACAKEAPEYDEMMQRSKKVYGIGLKTKAIPSGIIVWGTAGVGFFAFGVYNSLTPNPVDWLSLGMGVIFVGFAVFAYVRTKDLGLRV